ncbi:hypothetical protein BS50DRAFT_401580 [Corynespora cassiicola Philippines]|uniref:Uncharacterized protein n=1 Tax=Corynespora cassiicola Philippines TaxID=1448308 RepID=A0A2T2NKI0_CORCC|nr:hypothetical protein BS50DRAFT_401580 [Corynespora cassiicola Philippines]
MIRVRLVGLQPETPSRGGRRVVYWPSPRGRIVASYTLATPHSLPEHHLAQGCPLFSGPTHCITVHRPRMFCSHRRFKKKKSGCVAPPPQHVTVILTHTPHTSCRIVTAVRLRLCPNQKHSSLFWLHVALGVHGLPRSRCPLFFFKNFSCVSFSCSAF